MLPLKASRRGVFVATAFKPGTTLLRQNPSPLNSLRIMRAALHTVHPVGLNASRSFSRSFSMNSFPRFIAKMVTVPAAAVGSAVAGGAAYLNYKVQEVNSYTSEKLEQVSGWFNDVLNSAKDLLATKQDDDSGESSNNNNNNNSDSSGDPGSPTNEEALAAGVTAAMLAGGEPLQPEDGEFSEDQMMSLTKQMIEIRGILSRIEQGESLQLPSIVVIGSQSSGKSSVLEAIVGHEFLPKGNNMVTRRPIELTLINSPGAAAEYGEFPSLKLGKITDFSQIQKTLVDLNMAVSNSDVVSDDPIQLNIYSPHVPDLTLIDLPGYIQVSAADQPESLKQRIQELCEKYIQAPNVILAISAADVDLANSSALRASRKVDPHGERTIGVITKVDLVSPQRAVELLTNKSYALKMGYVGVITKSPSSHTGLFRRTSNITDLVLANEQTYFGQHRDDFDDCTVGTDRLKAKLMRVLERTMANSLRPTADAISQELEEATYKFKVEYNDRELTPQSYLAESVDSFKLAFKELSSKLGREEVRRLLRAELDQRVLDILAQRYWNKPLPTAKTTASTGPNPTPMLDIDEATISALSSASPDDLLWHRKLDSSASALTKLGIGRISTSLVIDVIGNEMNRLVMSTNFKNHPFASSAINEAINEILGSRFYTTSDQVENCIKPYKYEVEVEDRDWAKGRDNAYILLKEELRQCEEAYNGLKRTIGANKLGQVMKYVEMTRKTATGHGVIAVPDDISYGFSQALIQKGREAIFLKDRADLLKLRMVALKSRQCRSKDNKYYCPEVFLEVVADKLTQTAVLFLNVELLSAFYYNFPRELDHRLSNLTADEVEMFAMQDPKVKQHIECQRRKELLELALTKIQGVMELQRRRP